MPNLPRRLAALAAITALTAACGPTDDAEAPTAAPAVGADDTATSEDQQTVTEARPASDTTDDEVAWTAAEQEAIDAFGLERARPTLLAARRYADACPDGDFDVIPTYDEAPAGVAVDYAEPEVEQSHAFAYADAVVAFSDGTTEYETVEDGVFGPFEVARFAFTVDEVVWTQAGTAAARDGVLVPGSRLVADVPFDQPCAAPTDGHVGLGVSVAEDEVEARTSLVLDDAGRPSPLSRWLTAAAFEDIAAFADRGLGVELYLELHDQAGAASAERVELGCEPLDGTCPVTPGLLGEWRLARGHQRDPAQPTLAEEQRDDALDAWLATPWEERFLSDVLDDLPGGAGEALGVTWAFREVQVTGAEAEELGVDWLALRWPDVGTLCCFNVEDEGLQAVFGFGAEDGPVQLVGFSGPNPTPGSGRLLRSWDRWPGGETIQLRVEDGEVVGP